MQTTAENTNTANKKHVVFEQTFRERGRNSKGHVKSFSFYFPCTRCRINVRSWWSRRKRNWRTYYNISLTRDKNLFPGKGLLHPVHPRSILIANSAGKFTVSLAIVLRGRLVNSRQAEFAIIARISLLWSVKLENVKGLKLRNDEVKLLRNRSTNRLLPKNTKGGSRRTYNPGQPRFSGYAQYRRVPVPPSPCSVVKKRSLTKLGRFSTCKWGGGEIEQWSLVELTTIFSWIVGC